MLVRSAPVRGPLSGMSGRALALCCVAVAALSAAGGGGATGPGADVPKLRREATSLASRSHQALLDLYAVQTRLSAQRARLSWLRAATAHAKAGQAQVREQVRIVARAHRLSQEQLAQRLTDLYERGRPDPLAIVLGSTSLDEAISSIDALNRTAEQNTSVVQATRRSRRLLLRLAARLRSRTAQLTSLLQRAETSVASLEQAQAAHAALARTLARRERLTRRQITALDAAAAAAQPKTQQLAAAASQPRSATDSPSAVGPSGDAGAPNPPAAPSDVGASAAVPADGTRLTVTSTGYSLTGHTSTGLSVGWGIAAVDPSVIPLGTKMTIPGYGEAVAADTGGNVRGATIDLWFPTLAQARAWGRRTVTVTLH